MGFFDANASALPKIIQFTTISGIKIPKDLWRAGVKACVKRSTMVVKVAITIINTGIRIFSGVIFLIEETSKFEKNNTNVVATPIPKPLKTVVVTARVGHNPKAIRNMGF